LILPAHVWLRTEDVADSKDNARTLMRRRHVDFLRIVIAILLPPLGVFLQEGIGKHFWINILLTLLGYIPGIVHAVWIIAKR
jgi:uncharacterized membrane protein YqaE (UPF0057 family)